MTAAPRSSPTAPAASSIRDVLVLCYHALSRTWSADLSLDPAEFERQVRHLVRRGWRATTFTDAVTGTEPGRVLAITFDDAFASVRDLAKPILERYDLCATVFAPTAFMNGGGYLEWPGIEHWRATPHAEELRAMTWSDLRELADAGWEIGSHTCTHPHLTELDDADLARELTESRQRCAAEMGRPCTSIAYPFGDVDDRVRAAAVAAGYDTGARLSRGLGAMTPWAYPRVGIYNPDRTTRFRLKVASPVRRLRATQLWQLVR